MSQPRQTAGINQVVAVAQQTGDRPAPDYLHGVLLKEDVTPDAVFNIDPSAGDGQMNVRVLVELATVGMQGTEDTDLNTLFTRPPEYSPGGSPEQGVEEWPVVVEEGPQQVGHGEGDMLPVAVGKDMTLLRQPVLMRHRGHQVDKHIIDGGYHGSGFTAGRAGLQHATAT